MKDDSFSGEKETRIGQSGINYSNRSVSNSYIPATKSSRQIGSQRAMSDLKFRSDWRGWNWHFLAQRLASKGKRIPRGKQKVTEEIFALRPKVVTGRRVRLSIIRTRGYVDSYINSS
ncbi:hypothetical protein TNCT_527241 [Trichonephila clavata]|uniref:Uncharacterized protein n=1 Tax=Trichonephila clavata TaxID=2740835 RepID=A0A8X6HFT4_TRICU|nr:hypothetical protein TNCT_527241 [Trichonephila clavata]